MIEEKETLVAKEEHHEVEIHELTEAERIVALETELAKVKDDWLRALAEVENTRRRAQKEREEALRYGSTNFARDMLSVADNLRRALESCPQEGLTEAFQSLITGVEMTEKELLAAFDRQGIKTVRPSNEKFDPHHHQAMFEVETTEVDPGMVVQVMQPGYTIHDRLLRPAYVGVAKAPAAKPSDENS